MGDDKIENFVKIDKIEKFIDVNASEIEKFLKDIGLFQYYEVMIENKFYGLNDLEKSSLLVKFIIYIKIFRFIRRKIKKNEYFTWSSN